jgi:hypothetical protein
MNKYSKLNLKNIVVEVFETDLDLESVEAQRGGIWINYYSNGTEGQIWKIYNTEYDIFCEPKPIDINGISCNSWSLNTSTGNYVPPIEMPATQTKKQDDNGLNWYWDETLYQSDNTCGWILSAK